MDSQPAVLGQCTIFVLFMVKLRKQINKLNVTLVHVMMTGLIEYWKTDKLAWVGVLLKNDTNVRTGKECRMIQ